MYYLYMKVYCPSCGSAVHYAGAKPRFCSKCGDPIAIYAKTQSKPPKKAPPKNYKFSDDIDIEEDPVESIPQLSQLDMEIVPFSLQKSSLGQIMESQPNEPPPHANDTLGPRTMTDNQTTEEFLKEFQQEASARRPNNNG